MIRRLAALVLLPALALSLRASVVNDWSNYYFAVRDRVLAAGGTPANSEQPFQVDLGWRTNGVQCVTNVSAGVTNLICWTNLARVVTNGVATNFVATLNGTNYPLDFVDAAAVASIDAQLKGLFESGRFLDRAAIDAAGGVAAWFSGFRETNWYWLPDDAGGSFQWTPVAVRPSEPPRLGITQAWARAGLPVWTNWYTVTNTVTNTLYGWQAGALDAYTTNVVTSGTRSNLVLSFEFTAEPSRVPFQQLLAVAHAGIEDRWWEDPGTTGTIWTTVSMTAPDHLVPATLFMTAAVCTASWTPPWTNAPTNLLVASADFAVTGTIWTVSATAGVLVATTSATFTADLLAPGSATLGERFRTVSSISGPTNLIGTNFAGWSVSVLVSSPVSRISAASLGAHGAFWTNLYERAVLVSQLVWTAGAETAGPWHGLVTAASPTNSDAYWTNRDDWAFHDPETAWTNAGFSGSLVLGSTAGFYEPLAGWIELLYQDPNGSGAEDLDMADYQETIGVAWPTSRVHTVPFPAAASNLALEADYLGRWAGANSPTSRSAGVRWAWPVTQEFTPQPLWPYLECPTGVIWTLDIWDGVAHTVSVSWAEDALGPVTNAGLTVWHTVSKSAGVDRLTNETISVVSASPAAAGNFQEPAEHRHDWTGSYTNYLFETVEFGGYYSLRPRFVRPTQRTWQDGQWVLRWTFPEWSVTPP